MSQADRTLGRLDGSVETLPNPDLFVLMDVRKEAVLSSQIKGTQSSLQDLLAAEAQLFGADSLPKDVDEVMNDVRALKHLIRSTRIRGCHGWGRCRALGLPPDEISVQGIVAVGIPQ